MADVTHKYRRGDFLVDGAVTKARVSVLIGNDEGTLVLQDLGVRDLIGASAVFADLALSLDEALSGTIPDPTDRSLATELIRRGWLPPTRSQKVDGS